MKIMIIASVCLLISMSTVPAVEVDASGVSKWCSPRSNIVFKIPLKTKQLRPPQFSSYPLIAKEAGGYIIIYTDQDNQEHIALLPYRDDVLGNPTAETTETSLQIRGQVRVTLKPGFITLRETNRYEMVGRSNDLVQVRFAHGHYKQDFWVHESSIRPAESPQKPRSSHPPEQQNPNPARGDLLTTRDGHTYHAVTITQLNPCEVSVKHDTGAATIPYANLSTEDQGRYEYDAELCTIYSHWLKEKNSRESAAIKLKENAVSGYFRLLQVMETGALAHRVLLNEHGEYYDEEVIFIAGMSDNHFDGQKLQLTMYPIGFFTYDTVGGSTKKVRQYSTKLMTAVIYYNGPPVYKQKFDAENPYADSNPHQDFY